MSTIDPEYYSQDGYDQSPRVEVINELATDSTPLHRGWESAEHAQSSAESFIAALTESPKVIELAKVYGYVEVETTSAEKLRALKSISNAKWDFRSGKERQDVGQISFTDEQSADIFGAAEQLGMVESTKPKKDRYDFVTVLGGANMAPLLRVQYAKEQLDENGVKVPYMILLGSSRKLAEAEKAKSSEYAPGAQDEFDLMNGAVEAVFGVSASDEDTINLANNSVNATEKDEWRVRYYEADNGMKILSISAPQVEGERRVNTADTYRFMHEVVGSDMLEGSSILNVTTAHFVPFQHADALRLLGLPAKAEIETIGYSASYAGIKRQPHELLQEMNSAYNQANLLANDLADFIQKRIDLQNKLVNMMIETTSYEEAFGVDPESIYEKDLQIARSRSVAVTLQDQRSNYVTSGI